ncbi:MAG: amidase [Gammaproteobacteria bacterium]|jgi:amidase
MSFQEFDQYDATGLAELIRLGKISATEVVRSSIERIEEINPEINAVVSTCFELALDSLGANKSRSPLYGVPYLVKDFHTLLAGLPSTNGCRGLRDFVPRTDSVLVTRLRNAGLVILGKTNTPELGLNICTSPTLFGPTRNPLDGRYSAGGSSGGSAAAVAAGMLPAAHATDSGGSIRIPASNCGLFGLKPSRARVPLGNNAAEGLAGFSTVHAVTHSVRDSALILDVTQGVMPGDIYHSPFLSEQFSNIVNHPPNSLRIGVKTTGFANEFVHEDCKQAVNQAAALCEQLGHHVEVANPPLDGHALRHAFDILFSANVKNQVDGILALSPHAERHEMLEDITLDCAESASRFSAAEYAFAQYTIQQAARHLGEFFLTVDVLLTPTLANPPLPLEYMSSRGLNWQDFLKKMLDEIPFTPLFNATGAPAASIPLGKNQSGLPIGVQAGAALGNEKLLFQLASQLEQMAPWHQKLSGNSL